MGSDSRILLIQERLENDLTWIIHKKGDVPCINGCLSLS